MADSGAIESSVHRSNSQQSNTRCVCGGQPRYERVTSKDVLPTVVMIQECVRVVVRQVCLITRAAHQTTSGNTISTALASLYYGSGIPTI